MRGKRTESRNAAIIAIGSSPRARETCRSGRFDGSCTRFIPACAGNVEWAIGARVGTAVHPRVRGKRSAAFAAGLGLPGSSPRARETCWFTNLERNSPRFIPACAGNVRHTCCVGVGQAVHPRVRGKRDLIYPIALPPPGSSPRARETCSCRLQTMFRRRFIPACAGNVDFVILI